MQWTYRFAIKRPEHQSRRTFDIVCDKKSPNKRVQKSIKKLPEFASEATALRQLNESLDPKNPSSILLADKSVDVIVAGLHAKINTLADAVKDSIIGEANFKLFSSYWAKHYSARRLADKERTYNAFIYALRTLEPHSLAGSTQMDLQRHFDKKLKGTAHRRYVRCINSLLKFQGREFQLQVEHLDQPAVRFVTFDQFKSVLPTVEDPKLKLLIATLYAVGCRTSEAFALTPQSFRGPEVVFISHQIDRKLVRRLPKNRVQHDALIILEFEKELREWCALSQKEKNELRLSCAFEIPKVFKKAGHKITAHDLRHSYANHLLEMGVPIDRLAQFIGDSIPVAQKHYLGWTVADSAIQSLSRLLNPRKKAR